MAITRISQSSVKEGLEKFTSFYGGFTGPFGVYEPIATATVGAGGAATIQFGSAEDPIPQTYQHLQIRGICKDTRNVNDSALFAQFNGDTGSNYAHHMLRGGSATTPNVAAYASTNQSRGQVGYMTASATAGANIFGAFILDILDYSNSSKNTTTRSLTGLERNDFGDVRLISSLWINTGAVTSITLIAGETSFAQHSTVALYGIKAPA